MKQYKNFELAFVAASLDFNHWSPVVKEATLRINKGARLIEITIYQEYQSPINWSSKLATKVETKEYKPTETLDGFDAVKIEYKYEEA